MTGEHQVSTWRRWQAGLRKAPSTRACFLHVPKCGGTSITRALEAVHAPALRGGERAHFHLVPRRSDRAAEQLGIPVAELRDALLQYHLSNGRVRLVSGHFRWRPELREQFPDVVFLTLLREPVAHFLSSYFFQREERGQRNPITEDLATHLQSERALSAATRFVTFFGGADTPAGAVAPAAIARARHELARLDLVGVLEDLPAFTAAYERRFDRALHIPHAHRGNLRPKAEREEVTPELRARIEELVAPNRAVYDFVRAGMASPPR